jgi:hypothetical protein
MYVYVRQHFAFEVQPPRPPDLNPLDFCLWGHLKTMVDSAPIYNKQILHKHILCLSDQTYERVEQSIIRNVQVYTKAEDILVFVVNCILISNRTSTFIKLGPVL